MLMTVARVTGWPEREILWEIPLARLVQYVHAVWSYDATPCRWSCYTENSGYVGDVLEQARKTWREQIEQLEYPGCFTFWQGWRCRGKAGRAVRGQRQ